LAIREINRGCRRTRSGITGAEAPAWIRDAAERPPDRPDGSGPTHGLAFDTDTSTPLSNQPYRSGRNVASTADLRPLPGLKGFPWTLTDHAELLDQYQREPTVEEVQRVAAKAAEVEGWSELGADVFEELMRSILEQRSVNLDARMAATAPFVLAGYPVGGRLREERMVV
jgi:hypothetical protein